MLQVVGLAMGTAATSSSSLCLPSYFPLLCTRHAVSETSSSTIPTPNFAPASARDSFVLFKVAKTRRSVHQSCSLQSQNAEPSRQIGILIEVDGVLADVYRLGNRQSFNVAFQKLGLDCANWTEPIYTDLKKKAAGDEEKMLLLFFNRIGWPTSLPTSEKEIFMNRLLREKRKALEEFAMSDGLPLRPGVNSFIDEANKVGLPVILLTAYSKNGDEVCRSIIEKLGPDLGSKAKVIGKKEVQEISMEKQRVAEEVASILKLSVDIDASSPESADMIVAALRAAAECAELPLQDCVLIAGSQSSVLGAERVGMPCVVIRNSSTSRAEFRRANAVMDGFGGADLTISKLLHKSINLLGGREFYWCSPCLWGSSCRRSSIRSSTKLLATRMPSDRRPFFSGSSLWRRPASSISRLPPLSSVGSGQLHPDVDPQPRPWPVLQAFSFALVLAFAGLQFLPATHFRHPLDRRRSWIPFVSAPTSATLASLEDPLKQTTDAVKQNVELERINIVSWTDCLDLRLLAVLINSTLSNSRLPKNVYFSLFVPEGEDMKLSYYKMKVLFPDSNLEFYGQSVVKEKLGTAAPEWNSVWPSIYELTAFIIPNTNLSLRKFVFVSPDAIIKGNVEELFGVDMGLYAIAAPEDCSKSLADYVDVDILNAIQRTAAKSWISERPYDKDACLPDLNLLVIDAVKLDKQFLESILWWNKVLNFKPERNHQKNTIIAVALYNNYLKLPSAWKLTDSSRSNSSNKVLDYDGPKRVCSQQNNQNGRSGFGDTWKQHLSLKSDAILSN
ncbi:hypothetical protein HPP92_012287 [Vanilla planifolia]|uniref:Uncharacterized protein n=1 Tax=Vanilla planifolia TaxID=51239 RepID=A0A835QZ73_VANPL|nr:hypothetical protein HPP92_012287 [Vanilla planifolia]